MKINQIYPVGSAIESTVQVSVPNTAEKVSSSDVTLSDTANMKQDAALQLKIYFRYLLNKGLTIESQEAFLKHNEGKYNVLFLNTVKDFLKFKSMYDKIIKGRTVEEINNMSSEDIMQFFDEATFKENYQNGHNTKLYDNIMKNLSMAYRQQKGKFDSASEKFEFVKAEQIKKSFSSGVKDILKSIDARQFFQEYKKYKDDEIVPTQYIAFKQKFGRLPTQEEIDEANGYDPRKVLHMVAKSFVSISSEYKTASDKLRAAIALASNEKFNPAYYVALAHVKPKDFFEYYKQYKDHYQKYVTDDGDFDDSGRAGKDSSEWRNRHNI